MLIIPSSNFDESNFGDGDYQWGGELTLSGFPAGSDFFVKSYDAVDDDAGERTIRLQVDGVLKGMSTNEGNGTVETVTADANTINSEIKFLLGEEGSRVTGSGAVDNVEICRTETLGDEGCTLGYWKNHTGEGRGNQQNAWAATGYSTDDALEDVFDVPDDYELDDVTLLEALSFNGGGDATAASRLLLKQAVAAVLNASHGAVDYALTSGDIIAQVNAALATEDRSTMLTLKDELDAFNNAGCPLN